ncbi:uncharacterized protein LOC135824494 [Sycon ciliatum]|uniref:uncharacterized protein LOC135824494 n=1 Tax=Sycon ciliatum TaxID=27933 RepID=UPI0031F72099
MAYCRSWNVFVVVLAALWVSPGRGLAASVKPNTNGGSSGSVVFVSSVEECEHLSGVVEKVHVVSETDELLFECKTPSPPRKTSTAAQDAPPTTLSTVQHGVAFTVPRLAERTSPPIPPTTTRTATTSFASAARAYQSTGTNTPGKDKSPNAGQVGWSSTATITSNSSSITATKVAVSSTVQATLPPTVVVKGNLSDFGSTGAPKQKTILVVTTGISKTCGWLVLFRMLVINTCRAYPCYTTESMVTHFTGNLLKSLSLALSSDAKAAATSQCYGRQIYCAALWHFLSFWCKRSKLLGEKAFTSGRSGRSAVEDDSGIQDELSYALRHAEFWPGVGDNTTFTRAVREVVADLEAEANGQPAKTTVPLHIFQQLVEEPYAGSSAESGRYPRSSRNPLTADDHRRLWIVTQALCCNSPYCSALQLRTRYCAVQRRALKVLRSLRI